MVCGNIRDIILEKYKENRYKRKTEMPTDILSSLDCIWEAIKDL